MREIKFRAWNKKTGKPFHFDDISFTFEKLYEWEGNARIELPFHLAIIEQFTGLKDKNGREIYEGDVVRHEWGPNKDVQVTHVVWTNDGACFSYAGTRYDFEGLLYPEEWEVIGNIHENLELLEKK